MNNPRSRSDTVTCCCFFVVDHCNPNPCGGLNEVPNNPLNDGVCYEDTLQNTFVCDCPAGWVNFNCEESKNNIIPWLLPPRIQSMEKVMFLVCSHLGGEVIPGTPMSWDGVSSRPGQDGVPPDRTTEGVLSKAGGMPLAFTQDDFLVEK